jgi:uncharacterized protein YuzE
MTRITYDDIGQALAIMSRDGKANDTIEIGDGVLLDVDAERRPLTLEFVSLQNLASFFTPQAGEYTVPQRVSPSASGERRRA